MFAGIVAAINYVSRVLLTMGRHERLPAILGATGRRTGTPVAAIAVLAAIWLVAAVVIAVGQITPLSVIDDLAQLIGLGMLVAYLLACAAGPVFLRRRGELQRRNVVEAVVAMAAILGVLEESIRTTTTAPGVYYPFVIAGFLVVMVLLARPRSQARQSSPP